MWPTLAALAGLAVLVSLGTWQLQRRQWKAELIAKMVARTRAEPVDLARALDSARRGADIDYLHVTARGRFHHDKERYLYAPAKAGLGWHVYTPLETEPGRIIWVNRGFVPDARKVPATRADGLLPGEVEVRGLVREPAGRGLFTPDNDAARNLWYWPDPAAMSASAFAAGSIATAPFTIDADAAPAPPGGLPQGGTTRLDLPNRHLEYALTWFGLALTLAGVYAAFAASRLRTRPGQ